jgi:hypothetical protein
MGGSLAKLVRVVSKLARGWVAKLVRDGGCVGRRDG